MHFITFCVFVYGCADDRTSTIIIRIGNPVFVFQLVAHPCPDPSLHPAVYPLQSMIIGYFEAKGGRGRRPDRALTLSQKIDVVVGEDEFHYERFNGTTLKVEVVFTGSWRSPSALSLIAYPRTGYLLIFAHSCQLLLQCCCRRGRRRRRRHRFKIFPMFSFLEQPSLTSHQNRLIKIRR